MEKNTDLYTRNQVRFYDFYNNYDYDIQFYKSLLEDTSMTLLELGAGTGRVTISMAKFGYKIIGLDISQDMLQLAKEKLYSEPSNVTERVTLLQGDMSKFDLGKEVDTVIIPANSFLLLKSLFRQELSLLAVNHHLKKGSLFVVDMFNPISFLSDFCANKATPIHLYTRVNPSTNLLTSHLVTVHHDPASQILLSYNILEEYENDGTVRRYPYTETLRYLHRYEMELLLGKCGFDLESVFGWYDRRPFDGTSKKMIFVARKR